MLNASSDTGIDTGFVPGSDTLNKNSKPKPKQAVVIQSGRFFFRSIFY
jgi:hypothetical protein